MKRVLRFATSVTILVTLAACASGRTEPAPRSERPNGPAESASPSPRPTGEPSIEGDTPDERFQTWLETGGLEEIRPGWLAGEAPGEKPPADATDEQLQTLFDRWVQDNMRLIRQAWDRAQDKGAQADLRLALAVGLTYAVDAGSFEGFTPREGRSIGASLRFNESGTVVGEVSIRVASSTAILFTTESASGTVFCAAREMDGTDALLGSIDAVTVADCAGGWPE